MSDRNDGSTGQGRLTTSRVGNSGSGRLSALAVAGILAVIVWAGISGRSSAPAGADGTARPLATSAADPTTPAPARTTDPSELAGRRIVQMGDDAFAIVARVDDRRYLQVLYDAGPGMLHAGMRMAFPRQAGTVGELQLVQLWTRDEDRRSFVSIAEFELPTDVLVRGTTASETVIEAVAPAQPTLEKVPRLVRGGYRLSVTLESRSSHGFMLIDVRIGGPRPPVERPDAGPIR